MSGPRPRVRSRPAHTAWEPSPRAAWIAIGILTLLAAILRLARLTHSPPGLNQDEAINAWNAFCLLKTGRDMVGVHWPIFYAHSIGDNRTTLLLYWLIPFQALGGLSVVSMRAAAAVSGILCVPLIFQVGTRLFGRLAGVVAAALLVVNPWHFSSTRWAIDGSLVPFLTLATLALMLSAGLPIADGGSRRARPWVAALAGLVGGAGCYGYWAMRLHFPFFLALAVLVTWWHWRALLRSRVGLVTAVAFALGVAVTFGPLALRHLTDPAIAMRAAMTRLWDPGTPLPEIARRVLGRYAIHFGPDFLFVGGDVDPGNAPADSGAFEWVLLPLMLVGLIAALRRVRSSASCALLVALVLAYPVGDLVGRYDGVHAFRSSPGMAGLLLLAAWGTVNVWRWTRARSRSLAWVVAVSITVAGLLQDARSMATYFGSWPDRPGIYFLFHADFMQACEWVRPRVRDVDAVFWTTTGVNMPFAMTLVGLGYDPARWLSDPKDIQPDVDGWDHYVRYGHNYFLYGQLCRPYVEAMQADGRRERALFVVRPHELGLENPVHVIRGPQGRELLWICAVDL
jgi:4-amino-4-deoxy-L-arabinose transferase-like glycosyltransferase